MEAPKGRPGAKLDRRNALKRINYDATRSAPQSPAHHSFVDQDYPFGASLPSFRVRGVDVEEEIDRICRILGLSGPEAFAIPAAAWEARKAKSSRAEGKSANGEELPRISESNCPNSVADEETARRNVSPTPPATAEGEGFGESGEGRPDGGGREVVGSSHNFSEIVMPSVAAPSFSASEVRGSVPPILAPPPVLARPPSMSRRICSKPVSTWELLRSLAPEDDNDSPSSSSPGRGNDDFDDEDGEQKEEEDEDKVTEAKPARISPVSSSNGDESWSSGTEGSVYVVSPNAIFKVQFRSWIKGGMLGRGSFGTVYEGISDDGSFFAVKEVSLSDQGSNAKQCISQLEQEIALLSQFEHENIVQYLGTDKEQDKLYIFLELATQGSLASLYKKYHLIDSQVRAYTRQILNGLKYLHHRNVMHRDIKCANILVDANGHVKLADFGLAKQTSKLNELKSCKGSAYWMAPEVINPRKTYWLPADIWSLGCTVLEMATGHIPYGDLEWHRVMWKVGHGELPPLPDTLSRDAKDFIQKCLQVEPVDRPSAGELLDHPFVRRTFSAEYVRAPRDEGRFQVRH